MFRFLTQHGKFSLLLFAGLALLSAGCQGRKRPDFQRLQGTWAVTRVVIDDAENTDPDLCSMRMAIGDAVVVFHVGGASHSGYWTIDESKKPRKLTITPMPGESKHKQLFAIYELDSTAGALRVCFSEEKHPKKFEADAGSGCILIDFIRQ